MRLALCPCDENGDAGTTMPKMEKTLKDLKSAGLKAKVMIGGAPVTQNYADKIGADGYAADAATAVDVAKRLLK